MQVEFYSPYCGWCKKVANTVRIFGGYLRDSNVKVGKINCQTNADACEKVGVEGYPTFRLYTKGEDGKTKMVDYSGQRSISDFSNFLEKELGKDNIGKLQEIDRKIKTEDDLVETIKRPKTFKLISFTAEWCGHCKKLHPIWEALSMEIIGTNFPIEIADVNASTEEMRQILPKHGIDIKGFPTILFFDQDGNKRAYTGARTLKGFIDFLRDKTGYDIPVPKDEPSVPNPKANDAPDSSFLAAKYYENLARLGLENFKLIKELQSQMDEALILMRSVANVELPEEVQRKIDERKQQRELEKESIERHKSKHEKDGSDL